MAKPKTLNSVKPKEAAVEPVEEKAEAVETKTEKPKTLVGATKFETSALRKICFRTFGVTMSTFDGAFCGKEAESYTIDEARNIIEEFLKGEIKA